MGIHTQLPSTPHPLMLEIKPLGPRQRTQDQPEEAPTGQRRANLSSNKDNNFDG